MHPRLTCNIVKQVTEVRRCTLVVCCATMQYLHKVISCKNALKMSIRYFFFTLVSDQQTVGGCDVLGGDDTLL